MVFRLVKTLSCYVQFTNGQVCVILERVVVSYKSIFKHSCLTIYDGKI